MMGLCLAPVVLAGALMTIQTSWHKTESVDGALFEFQTCERGAGAHLRATSSGVYGLGAHYGFQWELGSGWVTTIQPRAGFSYVDHPVDALPLRTQFELGLQWSAGRGRWRAALDYWHLSNAGLTPGNVGLDMISTLLGVVF